MSQSETGALAEAASPTGISLVLVLGRWGGDTRGLCNNKKDLSERRGSREMELMTGSQPRLSVAEEDLELPASCLTDAGIIIDTCCQ